MPATTVKKPRLSFRPDPVVGWTLTPNYRVKVRFRENVVQTIGPDGWRHVPGSSGRERPRLAIYGCSFTYGTGLADDETYTAQMQAQLPELTVLNRGVGGHSTVQNFLQFRRDIETNLVDTAVFAIISDHRFRNIAHPQRMRQFLSPDWHKLGVEHVPVLKRDQSGRARIEYVRIWQPVLQRGGFDVFLPDDHMITAASLAILGEIRELAASKGIPVCFAVLDSLDPEFNKAVMKRFPHTLDISLPHDEDHTFMPADIHPNAEANRLYAASLAPACDALAKEFLGTRA